MATLLTPRVIRSPEAVRAELAYYDRVWAAYAWTDLTPPFFEQCRWVAGGAPGTALAFTYNGLQPPIILGMGDPATLVQLAPLCAQPGEYMLSWPADALPALQAAFRVEARPMVRMLLNPARFVDDAAPDPAMRPLDRGHAAAIEALIAPAWGTPDEIDAFAPYQLADGTFFGAFEGDRLIGLAGTHVVSEAERIADIGNVYVRPDHRRRGLGQALTARVVATLLQRNIATVFLNTWLYNAPARRVYRRLGFEDYCEFAEGRLWLPPPPDGDKTA